MKKRNFLIGLIFGITFFFNGLMPIVSAIEKNEYLSFGEASFFYPAVDVGDIIYWSFETRNDEFNVEVSIDDEIISENKTSDSGSYVQTNSTFLMFINLDREWFRDGWIVIQISINTPLSTVPDPTDPDPTDPDPTDPDPTDPDPTDPINFAPTFIGIIVGIGVISLIIYLIVRPSRGQIAYQQSISQKVPMPIAQQTPRKINENIKFCIKCGHPNKEDNMFCEECGTKHPF